MELTVPHNYFAAWVLTPGRPCTAADLVDVPERAPAPVLLAALERSFPAAAYEFCRGGDPDCKEPSRGNQPRQ